MPTAANTGALVTPDDVETALLRPLTATEQSYIDSLIRQASAQLRTAMPTFDERLAATDETAISPDTVAAMLAGVIKRYMVNPQGIASHSEGMGPYSETNSYTSYGKALSGNGDLAVTAADLAKLNPSAGVEAGTIRTRPPRRHLGYCR